MNADAKSVLFTTLLSWAVTIAIPRTATPTNPDGSTRHSCFEPYSVTRYGVLSAGSSIR